MSVINQMLNQLEQRGAYTTTEHTMVRAVPPSRRNFTLPLLALGLAILAGIVVWQWAQSKKPVVAVASEELHLSVKAVAAQLTDVSGEKTPNMPAPPALQLSFELSSVPLSSSLKQDSGIPVSKPVVSAPSTVLKTGQAASAPAESRSKNAAPPSTATARRARTDARTSSDSSPMKQISPAQQADAEFRKAVALMQQGRIADAIEGYESALRLDAGHDAARQALVALLLENKRSADAERVLQERLKNEPDHTGFTMLLARLQVDRGALDKATATLEKSLPYADTQADYLAFLAALLQRQGRHGEAIMQYKIVTQLAPGNGVWLMGYGISLQATQRNVDAKAAFQHALDTHTLSPDLQEFVQLKLKEL